MQEVQEIFREILQEKEIKRYVKPIKEHHKETYNHVMRVGLQAMLLAQELKVPKETLKSIGRGGLLHDLGKIKIPCKILNKNTLLTDKEKQIMDTHPRCGFDILKKDNYEDILAMKIVIGHHEYKKHSYPRKESKEVKEERRVPHRKAARCSEIVAVVDIFDALKHRRSYKDAFPIEKIKELIHKEFIGRKALIQRVIQKHSKS
ncbi:HD domain-containing protein [Candidatus Woesearchaeota archaeon]|nr:HD domain-containing protein [Candidatus Woesearchaeota archaeon]